jgi:hypothetical protein
MILQKIDFKPLYKKIEKIFSDNLPTCKFNKIKKDLLKKVRELANANFRCYQGNMRIIAERKKSKVNTQLISELELQVRIVGERRVKAKTIINVLLNTIYPLTIKQRKIVPRNWISDDIVYSVGEMIDRLTIEFIKVHDYNLHRKYSKKENKITEELNNKIALSKEWSRRVEKYLKWKLKEIDKKGYYECVEETRTYDIRNINK